jgi:pimeloyl-ACP methyl ester carboxylesterase
MDIILIPGLWLDGSSWDKVVPTLERAGHRAHPLTLPGMESKDADRSAVTLRDHLDAVIAAIDAAEPPGAKVVLVGHSAACGIAYAAMDARTDRVARVVYIGGWPTGDGKPVASGFEVEKGEIPMPDWSEMDDADLVGLDEAALAKFRERAIPSPAHLTTDPLRLSDERRYDVPVTAICPEFTSEMLKGWIEKGIAALEELAKAREIDYVDLPTGHWPQFTRPEDLGRAIAAIADAAASGQPPVR